MIKSILCVIIAGLWVNLFTIMIPFTGAEMVIATIAAACFLMMVDLNEPFVLKERNSTNREVSVND